MISKNTAPYGAGIRCRFSSSPRISNNTIVYNNASVSGGGIYTDYSSSPIVKNTILWGNTAQNNQGNQLALDHSSFPTFNNCDIDGGSSMFYFIDSPGTFSGTYLNNINSDPSFINILNNNYALQATSICKDLGDSTGLGLPLMEISNNPRVCYNVVDIGAYEICGVGIQDYFTSKNDIIFYPNPFSTATTLKSVSILDNATLIIEDCFGKIVKQMKNISGTTITINFENISNGFYLFRVIERSKCLAAGKLIRDN